MRALSVPARRKELRARVKANIDTSFPKTAAAAPAAVVTAGRAQPLSLTDATELLERREAELRSEVRCALRPPLTVHSWSLLSATRSDSGGRQSA